MIITGQTYSYSFYSHNLNKNKFDIIKQKAVLIKDFKNSLSSIISKDLKKYLDYTKIDFIKEFNTQIEGLTGQDIQNSIVDVCTAYSNKLIQINKKIIFKIQDKIIVEHYKKNTVSNKKGDLKIYKIKLKSTKLTKVITFIAKYGDVNLIEYLNKRLKKPIENNKKVFFNDILYYINKFTFVRLYKLALSKRNFLIDKYNTPIQFKSLSFRTLSRVKDDILVYNKNFNSVIKNFIVVGGYYNKIGKIIKINIPVKYNKKFHGNIKHYLKKETAYTVCIEKK